MLTTSLRRAALLGLAIVAGAAPARAHEHMYIGSTAKGGGALVLDYDFARAFPLVPLPGTTRLIGTDPAFNAQVNDDPARGVYRLKDDTRVLWVLTAIDPGVTVPFNGTTLRAAGNSAAIGKMPYLHQHPQWTVEAPGAPGPWHLSFYVKARGYADSPVYTATLEIDLPPTTTSTTVVTIPGQTTTSTTTLPCVPAACDDRDPCTIDGCGADGCTHDPVTPPDTVYCRLQGLAGLLDDVPQESASTRRTLAQLYRTLATARTSLAKGLAGGRKTPRKFKKAAKQLSLFVTRLDQSVRHERMPADMADPLRALAAEAYDQLALLQAQQ